MRLFKEIHRRSLWQVLGIYVALAWLALQVVDILVANFGLPSWFPAFALGLLIIGLPIVLTTAFIQRGGPTASAFRSAAPFSDPVRSAEIAAAAPPGAEPVAATTAPSGAHHHLFSWHNAIRGGVLAFALLGLVAAGWIASRALGIGPAATLVAQGAIEERAEVLIADFASPAGDEGLARTATEAFRVDFAQSRVVDVVPVAAVASALGRMSRDPETSLDDDLAREVAIREGIPAIVTGEINEAGGGFVLSAMLVRVEDGEPLASMRESAGDPSEIIAAIDGLSSGLRERIGESLGQLSGEAPLARVTTPSLDALRNYSQALWVSGVAGDDDRALALLEQAVEQDTAFAMAWRKLGTILGNRATQRARIIHAQTQAFAHRDRLPEFERLHAEAAYYFFGVGDVERAQNSLQTLAESYPDDDYAINNLGVAQWWHRQVSDAEANFRRAIEIDSTENLQYRNAVAMQLELGRIDEAQATAEAMSRQLPTSSFATETHYLLEAALGQYETAESWVRRFGEETSSSAFGRGRTARHLADLAAVQGKLADTERYTRSTMAAEIERGVSATYLVAAADLADLQVLANGDRDRALQILDSALAEHPLETIDAVDRPAGKLAVSYALAGRPDVASRILEEFEAVVSADQLDFRHRVVVDHARAWIAMAAGDWEAALEHFRRSERGFRPEYGIVGQARALDAGSRVDEAIAAYTRYVESRPVMFALRVTDRLHLGPTYERLGQLHDEQGDLENAAKYYALFVDLWADADAELQSRVAAAQARLQQIVEARG